MNAAGDGLEGRVALVTGGGRGIGRAIVEALAARGAAVVIADNGTGIDGRGADPGVAQSLAGDIGERARAFTADVASAEAAAAAVELATGEFGGLDIVVNNAAILRDALLFKGEPQDWDEVIRINLSGAYYVLRAATPVLRAQAKAGRGGEPYGWGRIVNLLSTAGLYGNAGQAPYASTKAGMLGLTRVCAMEMSRSGVTCNAVAPFAATRVTESIPPANEALASYRERALRIPAAHVAGLVCFLCGPAAQHLTGQLLGVRGREVFLFSQPRPVARIVRAGEAESEAGFAAAVERELAPHFTDLRPDLEVFDTDPIL